MSRRWGLVLGAVSAVAVAGCSSSSTGAIHQTRAVTTFTCCAGRDVNRTYHPGETFTLHWIKEIQDGGDSTDPTRMTLLAALDGGFATATEAKGNAAGEARFEARAVQVTDRTRSAPESQIHIPKDATPGLYNLDFKIQYGGGNYNGGASIIRIVAR